MSWILTSKTAILLNRASCTKSSLDRWFRLGPRLWALAGALCGQNRVVHIVLLLKFGHTIFLKERRRLFLQSIVLLIILSDRVIGHLIVETLEIVKFGGVCVSKRFKWLFRVGTALESFLLWATPAFLLFSRRRFLVLWVLGRSLDINIEIVVWAIRRTSAKLVTVGVSYLRLLLEITSRLTVARLLMVRLREMWDMESTVGRVLYRISSSQIWSVWVDNAVVCLLNEIKVIVIFARLVAQWTLLNVKSALIGSVGLYGEILSRWDVELRLEYVWASSGVHLTLGYLQTLNINFVVDVFLQFVHNSNFLTVISKFKIN